MSPAEVEYDCDVFLRYENTFCFCRYAETWGTLGTWCNFATVAKIHSCSEMTDAMDEWEELEQIVNVDDFAVSSGSESPILDLEPKVQYLSPFQGDTGDPRDDPEAHLDLAMVLQYQHMLPPNWKEWAHQHLYPSRPILERSPQYFRTEGVMWWQWNPYVYVYFCYPYFELQIPDVDWARVFIQIQSFEEDTKGIKLQVSVFAEITGSFKFLHPARKGETAIFYPQGHFAAYQAPTLPALHHVNQVAMPYQYQKTMVAWIQDREARTFLCDLGGHVNTQGMLVSPFFYPAHAESVGVFCKGGILQVAHSIGKSLCMAFVCHQNKKTLAHTMVLTEDPGKWRKFGMPHVYTPKQKDKFLAHQWYRVIFDCGSQVPKVWTQIHRVITWIMLDTQDTPAISLLPVLQLAMKETHTELQKAMTLYQAFAPRTYQMKSVYKSSTPHLIPLITSDGIQTSSGEWSYQLAQRPYLGFPHICSICTQDFPTSPGSEDAKENKTRARITLVQPSCGHLVCTDCVQHHTQCIYCHTKIQAPLLRPDFDKWPWVQPFAQQVKRIISTRNSKMFVFTSQLQRQAAKVRVLLYCDAVPSAFLYLQALVLRGYPAGIAYFPGQDYHSSHEVRRNFQQGQLQFLITHRLEEPIFSHLDQVWLMDPFPTHPNKWRLGDFGKQKIQVLTFFNMKK